MHFNVREIQTGLFDDRADDDLVETIANLVLRHVGLMLGRDHDGVDGAGHSAFVTQRDLGLAVGTQEWQLS